MEVAIFQELAEIKREVRAIRVRDSAQNALAVPMESAMAMFGCKRSQIFKLLEQRRLARASKVGRAVMITVASIEALLAAGAPQKCSTRSRTPKNQPESMNKRCRARRGEKPTGGAEQDPGKSIRNLVI
ncbi:hypothetical protein D7V97_00695 [Corallococcus sp. CA053C]|nr:hypothetical protein D7V97_00695 [Corallococcus sp. CA053C]